jgi:plasmid stabilization system protein ParE
MSDLEDILAYTRLIWGEGQMRAYAQRLNRAIAHIGRYPEIGRLRPDLSAGVRTFVVGAHMVVYTVRGNAVVVARILSHYQHLESALDEFQ